VVTTGESGSKIASTGLPLFKVGKDVAIRIALADAKKEQTVRNKGKTQS
jgi:hypothetical protein